MECVCVDVCICTWLVYVCAHGCSWCTAPRSASAQVAQGRNPKLAAKWVTNELFGHLQRMNLGLTDCPIAPAAFGALLDLVDAGTISGKIGAWFKLLCPGGVGGY